MINKKTARIVGMLFLAVNIFFLAGVISIENILGSPDYLDIISVNRIQIISGVLLEIANGVTYVAIAVILYPILKQRFQSLALGFVAFRLIEFVMQILADISPLSLLTLGEEFIKVGASDLSSFHTMGALLLADRYWAFQMVSITFGLGALMLYYMFYQLKLIPRFISIWGFIGATVVLVNVVLDMFGVPPGNLGIIMLLNELFLGVWLIVKGFNPVVIQSESTK